MSLIVQLTPHENPRIDALSDVQRLHWILGFTRRDLNALASDEIKAIGDDLRHAAARWWVQEGPFPPCINGNSPDMSAAQLCALQQEIRECIHAVMDDPIDMREMSRISRREAPPRGWVLLEGEIRVVSLRIHPDDPHVKVATISYEPNDRTAILMGVVELLSTCSDRFSTCQVCGTRFLRVYRQQYCTARCSTKIRNRRRLDRKANQQKSRKRGMRRSTDTASLTTA